MQAFCGNVLSVQKWDIGPLQGTFTIKLQLKQQ